MSSVADGHGCPGVHHADCGTLNWHVRVQGKPGGAGVCCCKDGKDELQTFSNQMATIGTLFCLEALVSVDMHLAIDVASESASRYVVFLSPWSVCTENAMLSGCVSA